MQGTNVLNYVRHGIQREKGKHETRKNWKMKKRFKSLRKSRKKKVVEEKEKEKEKEKEEEEEEEVRKVMC